ncbi:PepSY-associated TM helix domain-containing protein [Oxalicibacterium sp.]|uniref:PepSY-associated TM helix domain-containing protein n=1 Tax=Oxalicibacterium sp. TaxID=2766525 RepID=UPI002D80D805|nr:PepSY-associated TM helix domain-containing protein [Oxalicibacterium sp.]
MTSAQQTISSRTINMRRVWLKVHRWLALSVGWVLALVGLTGAILVVAQPLDEWTHPQLFKVQQVTPGANISVQEVHEKLMEKFDHQSSFTLRPPRDESETIQALVRGKWNGVVFLNPHTGEEQGRRKDGDGVVNFLFKLHSSLMLKDTGKAILAWIALAYLVLLITGLILWWPKRWPPSLKIELRKGLLRGLFDMHRIGGAVLGSVIAVSVATGAYMAWRPLGQFITTIAGEKVVKPPKMHPVSTPASVRPTLDDMVARAQAQFPNEPIGYIQIPAKPDQPVRVRMRLHDDPHPNGRTAVYIHPQSGEILAVHRWDELDVGARMNSVIYPLHTGELGGPMLEAVTFLSGLALGMLGITGIWLWWRRRN